MQYHFRVESMASGYIWPEINAEVCVMDWNWLWQGILSTWVYDLLVLATGGTMFVARMRGWKWASPALYGLSAATLMALTIYTISVHHAFAVEQAARTTTDNVQERVRSWLDNFGLTVQNIPAEGMLFSYNVTMRNGNQIQVARSKKLDRYVILTSGIQSSAQEKKMLSKLSKTESDHLEEDLIREAARAKTAFINLVSPYDNVILEKRVPITASLTEATLIETLDEMDSTLVVLKATTTMALANK